MKKQFTIDLNADVGEGLNNENELLPYLSSCNIACTYHAGSVSDIHNVIDLAIQHNVSIGAHPSYPDRENFGRKEMNLTDPELEEVIQDQLNILTEILEKKKVKLSYVKPHGALYHKASNDYHTASLLIKKIQSIDSKLYLLGFAGSEMERAAKDLGCLFAAEAFADRAYNDTGKLINRTNPNAVHLTIEQVWPQVNSIIKHQYVSTKTGTKTPIIADSICFHGDTLGSTSLLKDSHHLLTDNQIVIKSFLK